MDVPFIQKHLARQGLDAWLLYDFQGLNPLARRIAGLSEGLITRRWFCLIPREGDVRWLVSMLEQRHFAEVPGVVRTFSSWTAMLEGLKALLDGYPRVAMEYAPEGRVPYVSRVDGGTLEMVRATGAEVVSSADLIQWCEARWSPGALATHLEAAKHLTVARERAFHMIAQAVRTGRKVTEYDVQQEMVQYLELHELVSDSPPIIASGVRTSDPHYQPTRGSSAVIEGGDLVLIDLWAKKQERDAVYADITWVAYAGNNVPDEFVRIFSVIVRARNTAVDFIQQSVAKGETIRGYQVDDVARTIIAEAGYGDQFIHRTGHNIGTEDHGTGVNFDNLEVHDDRMLIPDIACSVEPGIYLGMFGMRSEVNIYIGDRRAEVTTMPVQRVIIPLLKDR